MAVNNTYGVKAVSDAAAERMVHEQPACINLINECQTQQSKCALAQGICNNAQIGPYEQSGLNPYDVRIECEVSE